MSDRGSRIRVIAVQFSVLYTGFPQNKTQQTQANAYTKSGPAVPTIVARSSSPKTALKTYRSPVVHSWTYLYVHKSATGNNDLAIQNQVKN